MSYVPSPLTHSHPTSLGLTYPALGPGASVRMRSADDVAVTFRHPGEDAAGAEEFGPLGEVVGLYGHDRERGYVLESVRLWDGKACWGHQGPPDTLTVEKLRRLGYWVRTDAAREDDAEVAHVVALARAMLARGKTALDDDRRRFVEIERGMLVDEIDRMRQALDAAESRRQELEREHRGDDTRDARPRPRPLRGHRDG